MTSVRRESLAEQAAGLLLARIRAGEWEVGGRLPGETTLAPQLGVGRSTVREAIRLLAGSGILTTRQGAGVFVLATDVPESWNDVVQRADIVAVIEARTAIEVEGAALAAERRTQHDLDRLRRALEERERHRSDVEALVDADMVFHRAVLGAAHSPVLLELFDGFADRSRLAMIEMLRRRGDHGEEPDQLIHERIYRHILDQQPDDAAVLTRTHLQELRAALR